jgi:hypothetical protein
VKVALLDKHPGNHYVPFPWPVGDFLADGLPLSDNFQLQGPFGAGHDVKQNWSAGIPTAIHSNDGVPGLIPAFSAGESVGQCRRLVL